MIERFADITEFVFEDYPEFAGLIVNDKDVGHDNMYHRETLLQHQHMVLEEALKLADKTHLATHDRGLLIAGSIWHDVGKLPSRLSKTRFVCVGCTKPHPKKPAEGCTHCGMPTLEREIFGYHHHAEIGARMMPEILARNEIDGLDAVTVTQLVRWHSHVHDIVDSAHKASEGRDPRIRRIPLVALLLSWAESSDPSIPPPSRTRRTSGPSTRT
jgi:hypothetical protein